MMLFIIANVMQ